jgi:hypothetical protein
MQDSGYKACKSEESKLKTCGLQDLPGELLSHVAAYLQDIDLKHLRIGGNRAIRNHTDYVFVRIMF